jgi:hypothetical protein
VLMVWKSLASDLDHEQGIRLERNDGLAIC